MTTNPLNKPMPRTKIYRPYQYPVLSYRNIDGDTVEVRFNMALRYPHPPIDPLDFGFTLRPNTAPETDLPSLYKCRLAGIDTPEKKTAAGKAVRRYTGLWLANHPGFTIVSIKKDKFSGRFIGFPLSAGVFPHYGVSPRVRDQPEGSLARRLWELGLCREYLGNKIAAWGIEELTEIEQRANEAAQEFLST